MTSLLKIALIVMALIFIYLFSVTFAPIPQTGVEHSKTIVPFLLGSGLGTFFGFYWGSSSNDTTKPTEPTNGREA